MGVAQAKKLTQDNDYELEEDEAYYVTRPHTSARRYNQPQQRDTLDDPDMLKGPYVQPRRSIVSPAWTLASNWPLCLRASPT